MMMYIQYRQALAASICKMHLLHYIIMVSNIYPLVNIQIAIENGPFIVGLPIKDGDFP